MYLDITMKLLQTLNEANVYNVSTPLNGVSITKYVQRQISTITDPTIAKVLGKKLSVLLVNDESNLEPLTDIPQGAPEWAYQALHANTLMLFNPSPALTNNIANIVHYVQAAINNSTHADNNRVVQAQRELASISKRPNIQSLVVAANKYFAIGTAKVSKDTTGLVQVEEYHGYVWYKLTTTEAFKREGETLQNCIGTHWTFTKAKEENMQIYVLRSPADNSIVAIRAKVKDVYEIKGKNNQTPIKDYMPYVFHFIKDLGFSITGSAAADLRSAGYRVFGGKYIVPLDQAKGMYYDEATDSLKVRELSSKTVVSSGITFEVMHDGEDIADHFVDNGRSEYNVSHYRKKDDNVLYAGAVDGDIIQVTAIDDVINNVTWAVKSKPYNRVAPIIIQLCADLHLTIADNTKAQLGISNTEPYQLLYEEYPVKYIGASIYTTDITGATNNDKLVVISSNTMSSGQIVYGSTFSSLSDSVVTHTATIYRIAPEHGLAVTLLADANNKIIHGQGYYEPQTLIDAVRGLINKVPDVTIDTNAFKDSKKIVVTSPTTIETKAENTAKKSVDNKLPVTVEVSNGITFEKISGDLLRDWLSFTELGGNTEAVYKIVDGGAAVQVISISKSKITGIFIGAAQLKRGSDAILPATKTISLKYADAIKQFATKTKVKYNDKKYDLTIDSKWGKLLDYMEKNPDVARTEMIAKALKVSVRGVVGFEAGNNIIEPPLMQTGLITGEKGKNGRIQLVMTDKGKKVLAKLRNGDSFSMFDLTGKSIPEGYNMKRVAKSLFESGQISTSTTFLTFLLQTRSVL